MTFINPSTLYYLAGISFIIFLAIYIFFRHSYRYWSKLDVPFVPPKMLYGSLKKSTSQEITLGEELQEYYNKYKAKSHKYVGLYLMHRPVLMILDVELVKNILSVNFDHFSDRGTYYNEDNDPLSAHLFALESMKWKYLRQKLTPAFSPVKLKYMFQTLVACAEEFKSCLDDSIEKAEPIDIKKIMIQYAIDVIGSCAFGLNCNSFKEPNSDFVKYGSKLCHPDFIDSIKGVFANSFPQAAKLIKMRATNKDVDTFFRNLVKDTIEYRDNNNVTRNDFMQLLIQLKNKGALDEDDTNGKDNPIGTTLTLNEVSAQAFIFFVAGFETSATTMTFSLYELAKNPEVQEKLRIEITTVLKKHDGKMTYDSIMEMRYMDKIIQETLRLHPPVPFLIRTVTKNYKLPNSDIVLRKNMLVFISVSALHYDPEYFPNPEHFDPERFSDQNKQSIPNYAYIPFGEGPRICIGLRFSMMEIKVGLCRLLSNYRFTLNPKTDEPIQLDPKAFINKVKNGVWLDAEKC